MQPGSRNGGVGPWQAGSKRRPRVEYQRLVGLLDELQRAALGRIRRGDSGLRQLSRRLRWATGEPWPASRLAATWAQSLVAWALGVELWGRTVGAPDSGLSWLVRSGGPFWQPLLTACLDEAPSSSAVIADVAGQLGEAGDFHFLDELLRTLAPQPARRQGVFYTPAELASFTVRSVDQRLREAWRLPGGLADATSWAEYCRLHDQPLPSAAAGRPDQPLVQILDPAVGSGVFLTAVIDLIHAEFQRRWAQVAVPPGEQRRQWSDYVARQLVPRIAGLERMLPAALLTLVNLAQRLAVTGFDFAQAAELRIGLVDTLADPQPADLQPAGPQDEGWQRTFNQLRLEQPMTVVIGNPPFSGISEQAGRWIRELLRGGPEGQSLANYCQVDGQPLGERKHWLEDDYVKFLRYSHWRVEQLPVGVVALVTGHGYLDNPTFRGLRQQLLSDFDQLALLNLHGNSKHRLHRVSGVRDQNVFAITQGVAVCLLSKSPAASGEIRYAELIGGREEKLRRLGATTLAELPATPLDASRPGYLFVPRDERHRDEYQRGLCLTRLMPQHSTAAVTARDQFVVDFDREVLAQRLGEFLDLAIPSDTIRRRYFKRTRSTHYAAGDTRGWKLDEVRRRLATGPDPAGWLQALQYRPWDQRWVAWSPELIDWPRTALMQTMLDSANIALIARRQTPRGDPACYAWATRGVVLDGLIRSDNKGSESFFPLYLLSPSGELRTNLCDAALHWLCRRHALSWSDPNASAPIAPTRSAGLDADGVLGLVYAQLQSAVYRERFADYLNADFPRLFAPRTRELLDRLMTLGRELLACHADGWRGEGQCGLEREAGGLPPEPAGSDSAEWLVAAGYPRYSRQRVYVNAGRWFEPVTAECWQFRAGSHQVARKWLRDRRDRQLTVEERAAYQRLLAGVGRTLAVTRQIDRAIDEAGGWAAAFEPWGPLS